MNPTEQRPVILMAEDDLDDRLLVQDALREGGYAVDLRFVADGVELMDCLRGRNGSKSGVDPVKPGLIILDLNMPKMDGREALREIKSDAELRRIPVVVLTTSTAGPDISKVYELGANSFISKPTAFDTLVKVMRSLSDYWFKVVALPVRA